MAFNFELERHSKSNEVDSYGRGKYELVNRGRLKYILIFTIHPKRKGDEEPCYSHKISIFSFIWAGLAALHKASTI